MLLRFIINQEELSRVVPRKLAVESAGLSSRLASGKG
jgi:hypothetical protein